MNQRSVAAISTLDAFMTRIRLTLSDREEKMSRFYNFDFERGVPLQEQTKVAGDGEVEHQVQRFIWKPISSESGSHFKSSLLAELRASTKDKIVAGFSEPKTNSSSLTCEHDDFTSVLADSTTRPSQGYTNEARQPRERIRRREHGIVRRKHIRKIKKLYNNL